MKNAVVWSEIAVADLKRATAFYEKLLDAKLKEESFGPFRIALFPHAEDGVGGVPRSRPGLRAFRQRHGDLPRRDAGNRGVSPVLRLKRCVQEHSRYAVFFLEFPGFYVLASGGFQERMGGVCRREAVWSTG